MNEDYVLWLEVSMNYPLGMEILAGLEQPPHKKRYGFLLKYLFLLHFIEKLAIGAKFHEKIHAFLVTEYRIYF